MAMRPLRPTRTHLSGGGCRGDAPRRPYLPRARMCVIDGLGLADLHSIKPNLQFIIHHSLFIIHYF